MYEQDSLDKLLFILKETLKKSIISFNDLCLNKSQNNNLSETENLPFILHKNDFKRILIQEFINNNQDGENYKLKTENQK